MDVEHRSCPHCGGDSRMTESREVQKDLTLKIFVCIERECGKRFLVIHNAQCVAEEERIKRYLEILKMREAGVKNKVICETFGISPQQVSQILRRGY